MYVSRRLFDCRVENIAGRYELTGEVRYSCLYGLIIVVVRIRWWLRRWRGVDGFGIYFEGGV